MKVGIASYGITRFSKRDDKIEEVLLESTKHLFDNTNNLEKKDIDAVLVSTNDNTKYLSSILSELSGMKPRISHTVESLCNSGTNAIVSGYSYIASGLADVVLVSGAERYNSPGQILEWDHSRGEFKHPIFWASIFTKAYKRKFSISNEDLALVSVKNHRQAQKNPYAISKKEYSLEDVLNSKKLTDDVRLLDCSRPCTGGASVLLVSERKLKEYVESPIWITGIGQKTTSAGFTKNKEFSSMDSSSEAAKMAFTMAKKEPKNIDVAELHDAFTVCEPMALEATGLAKKGEGMKLIKDLYSSQNQKINPRGGLIGSGHPLGATGIAQTIEIAQQLSENAQTRQVESSNTGLVHNMSAASTSSTVLVLEK